MSRDLLRQARGPDIEHVLLKILGDPHERLYVDEILRAEGNEPSRSIALILSERMVSVPLRRRRIEQVETQSPGHPLRDPGFNTINFFGSARNGRIVTFGHVRTLDPPDGAGSADTASTSRHK